MKTIKGDLLEIKEGIICHQVNCQRVAGAGLALQIRNKWPRWYELFLSEEPELGKAWVWIASRNLFVASLYAQESFGKGLQTDYDAFERALAHLEIIRDDNVRHRNWNFPKYYFPAKIGAGLAGGDPEIIQKMIKRRFGHLAILVEKV